MLQTHPPSFPNRERYSNDGRNSNNHGKFPVPLHRPENHGVELKQEERIQSLQNETHKQGVKSLFAKYLVDNEMQNRGHTDFDDIRAESFQPLFDLIGTQSMHFVKIALIKCLIHVS